MTFDKPFVQKAVDNNLENSVCVEYFWKCISFRKVHPIPKTCIGAINLWEFMQTMTDDTHFVRNRYWLKIVLETHKFSKKWHQQSNTTQSLLTTILTQSQFGNDKLWKRMVLDHSFLASLHPCFPPPLPSCLSASTSFCHASSFSFPPPAYFILAPKLRRVVKQCVNIVPPGNHVRVLLPGQETCAKIPNSTSHLKYGRWHLGLSLTLKNNSLYRERPWNCVKFWSPESQVWKGLWCGIRDPESVCWHGVE